MNPLFAISYQVMPELRQQIVGEEMRQVLAMVGMVSAYALLRMRASHPSTPTSASWGTSILRFAVAGIVTTGIWFGLDVVRQENFLSQLWSAIPPEHHEEVCYLLLFVCGWMGLSFTISELLKRLMALNKPPTTAETPTVTHPTT